MSHQSLNDLTDVTGSPTDGQILKYTASSSSWGPAAESGGGGASKPDVTAIASGDFTANNYTITTSTGVEEVFLMSPGAASTVTLPTAADVGEGYKYNIKLLTAQTLTITAVGSDKIDGPTSTTFIIAGQYGSVTLVSDGTADWYII